MECGWILKKKKKKKISGLEWWLPKMKRDCISRLLLTGEPLHQVHLYWTLWAQEINPFCAKLLRFGGGVFVMAACVNNTNRKFKNYEIFQKYWKVQNILTIISLSPDLTYINIVTFPSGCSSRNPLDIANNKVSPHP